MITLILVITLCGDPYRVHVYTTQGNYTYTPQEIQQNPALKKQFKEALINPAVTKDRVDIDIGTCA